MFRLNCRNPLLSVKRTAKLPFISALDTYTIEAMMQDGKALQAGTSHFLGQNFGKAFDVIEDEDGNLTLKINDEKAFWSLGKYLVIEVG